MLAELVAEIASCLLFRLRKRLPSPLHGENVVKGAHGTIVTVPFFVVFIFHFSILKKMYIKASAPNGGTG